MKIISKYKDYYDYLSGVYGVDEKVVLDRREGGGGSLSYFLDNSHVKLYLCGMVYDGLYFKGSFYWGRSLLFLPQIKKNWGSFGERLPGVSLEDTVWFEHQALGVIPYKDSEYLNRKENCPILWGFSNYWNLLCGLTKYPKLVELGIPSILPAKDIYLMLTEWLSYTPDIVDTRDDKLKILSNGFDLKTSFRKM